MMTGDRIARLERITRDPLRAGQRQSLALQVTTKGNQSLYVRFPLGTGADALMTPQEFDQCAVVFPEAPPPGVNEIQTYPETACARIYIRKPDQQLSFTFVVEDFLVDATPGTVELTLYADSPETEALESIPVEKTGTRPEILSFTASAYNALNQSRVALSWTLSEAADYALFNDRAPEPLLTGHGSAVRSTMQTAGNYVLKVVQGGEVVTTRHLRIHRYSKTGFRSYPLDLPVTADAGTAAICGILGLHAHAGRGRLYALLRVTGEEDSAQLWSTDHGFTATAWQPETNAAGETIRIPIAAATRPGAIIHDRLWLMGGHCCDPDSPGRDIGYYDFQNNVWHEVGVGDGRRWPDEMASRMGHAVVALPSGDRLWVMGGWSQDGGACGDIGEFDGKGWTSLDEGCELCLFGATATEDGVWRFGGFAEPGGAGKLTAARHDLDGKAVTHTDLQAGFGLSPRQQYCAGNLFALDPAHGPGGVSVLFANRTYSSALFFLGSEQMELTFQKSELAQETAVGVLLPRDYLHIQSAVFQGAVFFRSLLPDPNARLAPQISYLVKVNSDR